MIDITETETVVPICPHCETEIRSVYCQSVRAFLGRRYIYFCPHCRKVLGVSHRKGFWMG